MGLYCQVVLEDIGFPDETDILGIPVDYSEGITVFMDVFMESATQVVPVDTGFLRHSISAEDDGDNVIICEASAEYAQYVEYGTWCCPAQPYFEPAINDAFSEAIPIWRVAYQEALMEELEELEEMMDEDTGGWGIGAPQAEFGGILHTGYMSLDLYGSVMQAGMMTGYSAGLGYAGQVAGGLAMGLLFLPIALIAYGIEDALKGDNDSKVRGNGIGQYGGYYEIEII